MESSWAYIGGQMQGLPELNFPAFHECAAWLRSKGWNVISPAEMDQAEGIDGNDPSTFHSWSSCLKRDIHAMTQPKVTALVLLPGWTASPGANEEARTAITSGHDIYFYQPEGIYEDGWNKDKRLVAVSPEIVTFTMKAHAEQAQHDDQYMITSETIITSTTGAQKGQKAARFDLLPPKPLWKLAEHFGKGADKYAERNWEKGTAWNLNYQALMRHITKWWSGENIDEDGSEHLTAAAWHALVLMEFADTHPEMDNRPQYV